MRTAPHPVGVVTATLMLTLGSALSAQTAWLGVTSPPGLSLPPQMAVLEDGRFSAPSVVIPPGEARHTELEGDRILGWLVAGIAKMPRGDIDP